MNFQQGIRALLLVPIIALVLLVSPRDVVRAGIFGDFTIRDEVELGRKFNMMIRSSMPMIEDPVVAGYVRDMVQRIARGMPPQPFALEPAVIRNGALNAFATAGGYVYVFSGLILNADHEAELAGVVAHELAHVSQRHIAQSIEQSQLAGLGTLAAQLKYSREHEEEADQVGLHYLMEARYPPQGLVDAFQKIRRLSWLGGS